MPLFSRNVPLKPFQPVSAWRKIAVGTWVAPRESNIHARLQIDATKMLACIESAASKGKKLTPLAFLVKAVAAALLDYPEANVLLRWGRIYRRVDTNIFVSILVNDDLTGVLVRDAGVKSVTGIAAEIHEAVRRIKSGEDRQLQDLMRKLRLIPGVLMRFLLQTLSFFCYTLNWWTPLLGMSKDAFGSAQVTYLGPLDLEEGWGPLDPYARIPLMVAGGVIRDRPWVVDGTVVVRPVMPVCFTLDHRVIDGLGTARLLATVRKLLEDPEAI